MNNLNQDSPKVCYQCTFKDAYDLVAPKSDLPPEEWWKGLSVHDFFEAYAFCTPSEWQALGIEPFSNNISHVKNVQQ